MHTMSMDPSRSEPAPSTTRLTQAVWFPLPRMRAGASTVALTTGTGALLCSAGLGAALVHVVEYHVGLGTVDGRQASLAFMLAHCPVRATPGGVRRRPADVARRVLRAARAASPAAQPHPDRAAPPRCCGAHEAQQRIGTGWHAQRLGQPSADFASGAERNVLQRTTQAIALARIGRDHRRQPLREDAPYSGGRQTPEATDAKSQHHAATAGREVSRRARIAGMHTLGPALTEWAARAPAWTRQGEHHQALGR